MKKINAFMKKINAFIKIIKLNGLLKGLKQALIIIITSNKKMNTKIAPDILKEFTGCLNNKYFICYGTCLGAIRECNIMSHDLDIDVGIMRNNLSLNFINDIISKGFKLVKLFGMLECGLEMSFRKKGIKIDLMVFYQTDEIIWNSLWNNDGKNGLNDMIIHSYTRKLFKINKAFISPYEFNSLGIDYIKHVYGADWKKPIINWNWKTDHLCIDNELKSKILKNNSRKLSLNI